MIKYGRMLGFDDAAIAAAIDEQRTNEELARRGVDARIGDRVLVRFPGFSAEGTVLELGNQGGALIDITTGHVDAKPEWITRISYTEAAQS